MLMKSRKIGKYGTVLAGAIFSLGISLWAPMALAATVFNTDPADNGFLKIWNVSKGGVGGSSFNWGTSVTGDAGDTFNMAIYYHNTGSEAAQNVRVTFSPQISGPATSHTFTATLSSTNAPTLTGTVTINLSSSQTISFARADWEPNQTASVTPFPNGQTGAAAFSGGINLGTINAGWATQGNLIFVYHAGNNVNNPPCTVNCGGTNNQPALVTTNSASNLQFNSATLNGFLDTRGNTSSTQVWFEWGSTPSFGNTTSQSTYTGNVSFSALASNLAQNTTYYYRAVAQNSGGTVYGATQQFNTLNNNNNYCPGGFCYGNTVAQVTTNMASNLTSNGATLNGYLNSNNAGNVSAWFEWGPTISLGNYTPQYSYGSSGTSFSYTLANLQPTYTYYFRAVAQNGNGISYGNILTFTTNVSNSNYCYGVNCGISNQPGQLGVATGITSNVGQNSARVAGVALISNGALTDGWFEWGLTQNLGNTTIRRTVGSQYVTNFSDDLTGLSAGTTYYYRAVGQNAYGVSRGDILSFRTASAPIIYTPPIVIDTPPVVRVSTGTGTARRALAELLILPMNGSEGVAPASVVDYRVEYRNVSEATLDNTVLAVVLPNEFAYVGASAGSFSKDNNTLTYRLGALRPDDRGEIRLSVEVNRNAQIGKTVLVSGSLDYTNPNVTLENGAHPQEEVTAYAVGVIDQNARGGGLTAAVGSSTFLPDSLLEWLALIVIIFLVIFLGRNLVNSWSAYKEKQN